MNAPWPLLGQRSTTSRNWHSIAARGTILTASTWTAILQLWSPSSLAHRAGGGGEFLESMNIAVLALCALGFADLLLHDLWRRLLLPKAPAYWRAQVCVGLYSALGLAAGARAFVAAGDPSLALQVGAYYALLSAWTMAEALAIAEDQPHAHGDSRPEHGISGEALHGG